MSEKCRNGCSADVSEGINCTVWKVVLIDDASNDASNAKSYSPQKPLRPRRSPKPRTDPSIPNQFDRRRNLIIAGLPEVPPGPVGVSTDEYRVMRFCDELGVEFDPNITVSRLKKKNPSSKQYSLLRVEFDNQNSSTRSDLLKKAKHLRDSKLCSDIYIRPDLNQVQVERNKVRVAELKRRRGLGHDVIFGKNGSIIYRP